MPNLILILLAITALSASAEEPDWKAFDNPDAVLLTADFAKKISTLEEPARTAAIERLAKSLSAADVELRRRASLTLGALGDHRGVPAMIVDMKLQDDHLRGNATVALRVLKDRRAIPVLREALSDISPYVRSIALAALGELKATEAIPEIAEHLQDKEHEGGACRVMYPASSAAYALGAIGEPQAIPFLIQAIDDPDIQPDVIRSLSSLTDKTFGKDVSQWKSWCNTSRKK